MCGLSLNQGKGKTRLVKNVGNTFMKKILASLNKYAKIFEPVSGIICVTLIGISILRKMPDFMFLIVWGLSCLAFLAWFIPKVVVETKQLKLNKRWQVLAWTHYRQILSEAMVKSLNRKRRILFDFVTFHGWNFEHMLKSGFYSEFQYAIGNKYNLDMVIFDIEYLDDFLKGIEFQNVDRRYRLVPNETFLSDKLIKTNRVSKFKKTLTPNTDTYAIPLRWGFNGVTIKLSPASIENLAKKGIDFDKIINFDINWLIDENNEFYKFVNGPSKPCRVIALDWYLPTMMLIAWHLFQDNCHELDNDEFTILLDNMKKLKPLMCSQEPLVEDPLNLAKRVHKDENLIVLGGGNWLSLVEKEQSNNLKSLPIKEGYLLWCECLGFLAPNNDKKDFDIDNDWTKDACKLVKWITKKKNDIKTSSSFQSFDPSDTEEPKELDSVKTLVRKLPPRDTGGIYVCRAEWENKWNEWKKEL